MNYLKKNMIKALFPLFICFNAYSINIKHYNNSSIGSPKSLFSTTKTYLQEIKESIIDKYTKQYNALFKAKVKLSKNDNLLRFLDQLGSGQIAEIALYAIDCPDLDIAEAAFTLLKRCWPWYREYTFLIPNLDNNKEESAFIAKLRTDIMKLVEIEHITRTDYITKHTDTYSFEIILKCLEHCILLQTNADLDGLFNEVHRLRNRIIKNGRKTILIDNICLAIAEKIYLDPVTKLLHTVKYAPTLKEAEKAFREVEKRMKQEQAKGKDITKYSSLLSDHLKVPLYTFLTSTQNRFTIKT